MSLIDQQNSIVIDVTYICNAKCHYCQWGDNRSSGRVNQPDNYIYISKEILKQLKTERIVLSGGEPLLRHDLEKIVSYYRNIGIQSIVVITNGLLLTDIRLKSLFDSGLTGITISIDSIDPDIVQITRAYNESQIERIKSNFIKACTTKNQFSIEIGVNVVVSSANIQDGNLEKLVEYLNDFRIDWIKFQPIFDDGYVGRNAPHLLLSVVHSDLLRKVGRNILQKAQVETNPISFWDSLADILQGKKLNGATCGLDTRQAIAQKGKIKICCWIDYPTYDITTKSIDETQREFSIIKKNCNTGTFCYCLQNLSHQWQTI